MPELDQFADARIAIAAEAEHEPETVTGAPHATFHRRRDEVAAARRPVLRRRPSESGHGVAAGVSSGT